MFAQDSPEGLALRLGLALRGGRRVPDLNFDRLLPPRLRLVSGQYWTPLDVAARAAGWLEELHIKTVVDIGSGAGKFCVAAALGSQCHFTGVEHRPQLVSCARNLARLFNVEQRVSFTAGAFGQIKTPAAECYYFFNPFGENLFSPEDCLGDDDVELSQERYRRDVASVERLLASAPIGTYVLTYNGFGGLIPDGLQLVRVDEGFRCPLQLARKIRGCSAREHAGELAQ